MHPDAEDTDEIYANTNRVANIIMRACIAGFLIGMIMLSLGCAAKPAQACPKAEAMAIPTERGTIIAMTESGLAAFWRRAQMMALGECAE